MSAVRSESCRSAGLQLQPRVVETLDQAGLAEVLFTKLPESLAERAAVAAAFGKCLQVQQDGDCLVVFARFFAADERVHVLPGLLLPERQGIQALLPGSGGGACQAGQFLSPPPPPRPVPAPHARPPPPPAPPRLALFLARQARLPRTR